MLIIHSNEAYKMLRNFMRLGREKFILAISREVYRVIFFLNFTIEGFE